MTINIMMIMPLIVVNMTKSMTGNTSSDLIIGFLVKLVAFIMFVIAYIIGTKMMKIEV